MTERLAYAAENVLYLIEARHIYALWTPDAELAAQGAEVVHAQILDRSLEIEVLAEATLYRKNEGATFAGWVVKCDHNTGDPIRYKSAALECMGELLGRYFAEHGAAPAAPRVYDYGTTSARGTVRHCVEDGAGELALCDRTMRYLFDSTEIKPSSAVASLSTCRGCTAKVNAAGMVTRRRAAELEAERAAAEAVEQPAPELPAGASPEFAALVAGALTGRPAAVEGPEAEAVEQPAAALAWSPVGPLQPTVGARVMHRAHRGEYVLTSRTVDGRWWARSTTDGPDITIDAAAFAGGVAEVLAVGEPWPAPALHDAITIAGMHGVWIITHTLESIKQGGPAVYDRTASAMFAVAEHGFYRAQAVWTGGDEFMATVLGPKGVCSPHGPAIEAEAAQLGVWFVAGNGPVVVPIPAEYAAEAPRALERVRRWQLNNGRDVNAVLVERGAEGWLDELAPLAAPPAAPAGRGSVIEFTLAAQAELEAEAVEQPAELDAPVPLPEADQSAPLARRDLVTYNGARYVIIRADSVAEATRGDGHVELYPGNTLPDWISGGERGHWAEASACTRRLLLEWAVRYTHPTTGKREVVVHPGRAYAECAVEMAVEFGDASARLLVRPLVATGEQAWQFAAVRTRAEREAAVSAFLASLD
jgi:hypothetical protein